MITSEVFYQNMHLMQINFNFDISKHDGVFLKFLYSELKDKLNDEFFSEACCKIIRSKTKEEWNKLYGYGSYPALADWLDMLIPKKIVVGKEKCRFTNMILDKYDYPEHYKAFLNQKIIENKNI